MAAVRRKKPGEKIFDAANLLFMFLFLIIILYPIFNMVSISVSDDYYVLSNRVTFFPKGFDLDAYSQIFANQSLMMSFLNTAFVAVAACLLGLALESLAAYPIAYSDFIGKKVYTSLLIFTMWFSGGMIPTFLVVKRVGLLNSLWALVVVSMFSAYHVIILRAFFQTIPISLIESAKMDGANDFTILFRIVWPLSKPALALVALWIIVANWNSFLNPLIYLNDINKYTLQLVLRDIVLLSGSDLYGLSTTASAVNRGDTSTFAAISEQTKNAVIFVSMIPMLVLYPFLQKYFVKGIMLGAVKE